MSHTEFLRSDELPGDAALGYLTDDSERTNVFHIPVIGGGDGGIYSTVEDLRVFWVALFAGQIVPERWVAEMVRPRSDVPEEEKRYGLGFWLHASSDVVMLEGYDAGVSFRTMRSVSTSSPPGRSVPSGITARSGEPRSTVAREPCSCVHPSWTMPRSCRSPPICPGHVATRG